MPQNNPSDNAALRIPPDTSRLRYYLRGDIPYPRREVASGNGDYVTISTDAGESSSLSAMSESAFELVTLRGGERSIRSVAHGETMHIGSGPGQEALELHVRQQRLRERAGEWNRPEPFVIWDIGLGPAGNAITAIAELRDVTVPIEIHSFEISTEVLEFALLHAEELDYLRGWEGAVSGLLSEGVTFPRPNIRWVLHRGDFSRMANPAPSPSVIFFDPYSPARNSEMWSLETFRGIWGAVSDPNAPTCTMTNYTRSTSARVTMALAGWYLGKGVPTGEKDETTIASNRLDLLEQPLGKEWLSRVHSSTNAAPLRGRNYERGPIAPEDYARLLAHPQFAC